MSRAARTAVFLGISTIVIGLSLVAGRVCETTAGAAGIESSDAPNYRRTRTPTPTPTATATATTTPTATATPNSSMSSVQGVYVVDGVHEQNIGRGQQALMIDTSMAGNSNVDGFTLSQILNWSDIEPSDGNFQWQTLDSLIAQAAGAGKKVTIGVLPGWATPPWVYAAGAQSFSFVWDQTAWGPAFCSVAKIPVPWDPVFLEKWSALIAAFGAHYNGNYTVAAVKIEGINSEDEETNLPALAYEKISDGKQSCTGYDSPVLWQNLGYTRTLMLDTWLQIAGYYQKAFPNKLLTAVLQPGNFPPIDENGKIFKGLNGMDQFASDDIMAEGATAFGAQLTLQNDGLSNYWIWTDIIAYASQLTTGYQTVAPLGGNLPATLTSATSGGADYVELYESDLTNPQLTGAIANARAQMH